MSGDVDAAVTAMLARLAGPNQRITAAAPEPETPLARALVKMHAWLTGLRQNTRLDPNGHKNLTSYLRWVAYAWSVDARLFSEPGDGDQMSGPQRDEKDSVEAMVDVAVMLIQHVLEKCLAEEALVVGEVVDHMHVRNEAPATKDPKAFAYRLFFAEKLLPTLAKVVFPSLDGLPALSGDPIRDGDGKRKICNELKYAALEIVTETQSRSTAARELLKKAITVDMLGSILRSGYDMHLSFQAIEVAWRLLPKKRSQKGAPPNTDITTTWAEVLEGIFTTERFANSARQLREDFARISEGNWVENASRLLEKISASDVPRGQCFNIKDVCYDGIHFLPAKEDCHVETTDSLEPAQAVSAFEPTRVWFGRDSVTFLTDEPPEVRKQLILEEENAAGSRPDLDPNAIRDARVVVPFVLVEKVHVREIEGLQGHYEVILLTSGPIAIEGRPYPSEPLHRGTAATSVFSSPAAKQLLALHSVVLLLSGAHEDLWVLERTLLKRQEMYPKLGEELYRFPRNPSGGEAPKPKSGISAASSSGVQPPLDGKKKADAVVAVPLAPRKSSQAAPVETTVGLVGEAPAHSAKADSTAQHKSAPPPTGGAGGADSDLQDRRSKLAKITRVDSPGQSSTASRVQSKESDEAGNADAMLGDYINQEYGGGFDDEQQAADGGDGGDGGNEVLAIPVGKAHRDKSTTKTPERAQDGAGPKSRSPRVSPSPAADTSAQNRSEAAARKVVVPASGKKSPASVSKDGKPGRQLRDRPAEKVAAANGGRKRHREEDGEESESESPSNEAEASDEYEPADKRPPRRAARSTKAVQERSKRRKVESPQPGSAEETDYEEFTEASLPKPNGRPRPKNQFGRKTDSPRPTTGRARKANVPSAPSSKTDPKTKSEGKKKSTAKAEKDSKGSAKTSSTSRKEPVEIVKPGRTTRSRAKKKVEASGDEEDEARSSAEESVKRPRRGDKRVADDIPAPADLTSSERVRAEKLAPKVPAAKLPAKAKPVTTLALLTREAAPSAIHAAGGAKPLVDDARRDDGDQQEYFEQRFEFAEISESNPAPRHETIEVPELHKQPVEVARGEAALAELAPVAEKPARESTETLDFSTWIALSTSPSSAGNAKTEQHPGPNREGGVGTDEAEAPTTKRLADDHRDGGGLGRPAEGATQSQAVVTGSLSPVAPTTVVGAEDATREGKASLQPQEISAPSLSRRLEPQTSYEPSIATKPSARPPVLPSTDQSFAGAQRSGFAGKESASRLASSSKAAGRQDEDLQLREPAAQIQAASRGSKARSLRLLSPPSAPVWPSAIGEAGANEEDQELRPRPAPYAYRDAPKQSTPLKSRLSIGGIGACFPSPLTRFPADAAPAVQRPAPATQAPSGSKRASKGPVPAAHPGAAARSATKPILPRRSAHDSGFESFISTGAGGLYRPVLEAHPSDPHEEFFNVFVDLGRALVKKQKEQQGQLAKRRELAMQKIEKLVVKNAEEYDRQSAAIAEHVAERSERLGKASATMNARACAHDVRQLGAHIGDEVRGLLRKLAAEDDNA